jgi:DNA-binding NarL/FixJ family response regulator
MTRPSPWRVTLSERWLRDTLTMKAIRILLVDDQRTIRQGLRMRLAMEPDMAVIGEAENGEKALTLAASEHPDVVVMDVEMPGMDGIEATRELIAQNQDCAVVMLSIHDSVTVREAANEAGAFAFIAKHEPGPVLLNALRRAAAHEPGAPAPP